MRSARTMYALLSLLGFIGLAVIVTGIHQALTLGIPHTRYFGLLWTGSASIIFCLFGIFILAIRETMKKRQSSATLTYVLPEDEYDLQLALNAHRYYAALHEFKEELFYLVDEMDPNEKYKDARECADHLFKRLLEIAEERKVDWD